MRDPSKKNRREMSGIIGSDIDKDLRNSKPKTVNDDTIMRRKIQAEIIEMINSGKGKIEVITELENKYKESKLCIYISTWYEHHYSKINDNKIKEDDEGKEI